jgi:hypothetical protein
MRTASLPRLIAAGLPLVMLVGCSAAAQPVSPTPSGSVSTATPTASTAANPTGSAGSVIADDRAKAWLLVGRRGEPDLQLILSTGGEDGMRIPAGSPRTNWDRILTATSAGDSTIVRELVVQPGFGGPELRVAGRWHVPMVGLDPIPAGRSLDGSTIALVEGADDGSAGGSADESPGVRRFAIVEHHLLDAVTTVSDSPLRLARVIELPGDFEYDALSPDGRILYVVEHLDEDAGGRYQVRAVDVGTGVLRDAVIVDKTRADETMAGAPIAQVRRPGGLVLTLYAGPEHPFIHALNSAEAWAVCIDLPAGHGGESGAADAALQWGLAPTASGSAVYAVNAALGLAVDVDPAALAVRRSASIATTADAPIVLAKFGHIDVGPIGRRVVASPDGSMVFAGGPDGVVAIRARDLTVVRRDLAGAAIDGLGIMPNGLALFALLRSGEIVALDASSGRQLGAVPGSGYDRLMAVAPW